MKTHRVVKHSESFKLEVVNYYQTLVLSNNEVCRRFGITGGKTLNNWIHNFGKEELINKVIRMETPNEKSRLKELEKENRKLKDALSNAYMDKIVNESMLESTAELLGITVEELKKKFGEKQ
jgi:transposase-like protein